MIFDRFRSDRREVREARPYTDAVVAAIIAANSADTKTPDPALTGSAEVAAGVVGRAFASADVSGYDIGPDCLNWTARDMLLYGEACMIELDGERVRSTSWDIKGRSPNQDRWTYSLEIPVPDGSRKEVRPGTQVAHCRYSTYRNQPWVGVSPLARAARSGELLALAERALRNESSGPVGYVLPLPTDGNDESINDLKQDIGKMAGSVAVVETTAGGFGEGRAAAPSADWRPQRIGPNPPAALVEVMKVAQLTVLAALGVPIELVTSSDGTGQREAWRRFLHGTVEPLARIVEKQLARLAGVPVKLSFERLFASDISGRARAFGSLVNGGMDIAEAAAAAGLLEPEDR